MVANAYDSLDFMHEKHESSNRHPFEHSSRLTEGILIPSVFDFISVSLNRYIKKPSCPENRQDGCSIFKETLIKSLSDLALRLNQRFLKTYALAAASIASLAASIVFSISSSLWA